MGMQSCACLDFLIIFFKLFFILVANVETKAQRLSREPGPAAGPLPTFRMFLPWLSGVLQLLKDLEGVWIKTGAL